MHGNAPVSRLSSPFQGFVEAIAPFEDLRPGFDRGLVIIAKDTGVPARYSRAGEKATHEILRGERDSDYTAQMSYRAGGDFLLLGGIPPEFLSVKDEECLKPTDRILYLETELVGPFDQNQSRRGYVSPPTYPGNRASARNRGALFFVFTNGSERFA